MTFTNAADIVDDDFVDAEDLDGLFSGFNAETGAATTRSAGRLEARLPGARGGQARRAEQPQTTELDEDEAPVGAHEPRRDETLQHPRCVYQVLRRHYSRYTPEAGRRGSAA